MKTPNVYDYINHSGRAVRDGYKPCYLTRVSTVVCSVTSNFPRKFFSKLNFGMDETLKENLASVISVIIGTMIFITLPVSCWFLAFLLPKGGKNEP